LPGKQQMSKRAPKTYGFTDLGQEDRIRSAPLSTSVCESALL
jgi:hypothetical protein